MRVYLLGLILMITGIVKAQSIVPQMAGGVGNNGFAPSLQKMNYLQDKKWSFTRYSALTLGYQFYKGGSATLISAPIGLQLNRKLNNNLYAFTGVSIVPSYIRSANAFLPSYFMKSNSSNGFMKPGNFGINSKAELGIMYINNEKTFSISGSIGVERSSYPAFYNGFSNTPLHPVFSPQ